jgi:leucyl/phenylalanyl-tRNA--protein transferase
VPIFQLSKELIFPPPELAGEDGILAVGGDLSEKRLLLAYSMGIFPWYSENSPILWWSPDPRLVLLPDELRISRSLRQALKKNIFTVSTDRAFDDVICNCAQLEGRKDKGTWITPEMIDAYKHLHRSGYAHSVEAWHNNELAGGLYGVALGSVFFGESMFSKKSNASKVAFVTLAQQLVQWGFTLIDCQITTRHLMSFGAREIPRKEFLELIRPAVKVAVGKGCWKQESGGLI